MPTIDSISGSAFNARMTALPTLPVAPVTTTRMWRRLSRGSCAALARFSRDQSGSARALREPQALRRALRPGDEDDAGPVVGRVERRAGVTATDPRRADRLGQTECRSVRLAVVRD